MKLFLKYLLIFVFSSVYSQTVNVTTNNTGCKNSGVVSVSTSGITSPTFQLQLSDGTVVAPAAGNSSAFSTSNVFGSLTNGTYKVVAKDNVGTLFTSSNLTVTDGYTNMVLAASPVSLLCIGSTKAVPVSLTGGKSPYVYVIKNASNVVLETSASTSSTSYTFAALPQGSYSVSVTDACSTTITSPAVLVNDPTATVSQLNVVSSVQGFPSNCGRARLFAPSGFTKSGVSLTATERSLFTYKIKFKGNMYGVDTSGDGFPDLNTNGIALDALILQNLPIIITRDEYYNPVTRPTILVSDQCGNTKEIAINISKDPITGTIDCTVGGRVRPTLQASLLCAPVNFTFTNVSNPSDVKTFTQTVDGQTLSGFTLGATYKIAYVDGNGNTSTSNYGFSNTQFTIPSSLVITTTAYVSKNVDFENYGTVTLNVGTLVFGDSYSFEVIASNNPSVAIGFNGIVTQGNPLPRPNTTAPINNWPDGLYTLKVATVCGTSNVTFTISGYTKPTISGNSITPICGGFNYVMNGTFNPASDFVVDIISGPSNVGLSKSLISSSASNIFPNLAYGTYKAGIRVSSGTRYMNTQTFSFGENGVITVDKDATGGFVCTSGGTDGILTILASTISPAPSNILEYRISLDGGLTYGSWQISNTFSGLSNTTYKFQVKDGCGFLITDTSEVGSIANPQASGSYLSICELQTGDNLQLRVDTANATYLWTGPGINATNQNQRNPILNLNDLNIGVNNYTVSVTSSFCGNSTTANVSITKISSTKAKALTGIEKDSKFGISTQGSTKWLTTTKNGALVLESSNKGFVITRMKTSELPTGTNAIKGMLAYDTDINCLKMFNGIQWKCIARVCP